MKTTLMKHLRLLSAAAAVTLTLGCPPASASASTGTEVGTTGYVGQALDAAGYYWTFTANSVMSWMPEFHEGSMLSHPLDSLSETSDTDFKNMMSVAGYAVKSINMGVGIVPKFSFYFGQKREMSEADHVFLRRLLRKHERNNSGPLAASQRLIIEAIIHLQGYPNYDLTKVSVTMLPLPNVEFVAEPKEKTLDSGLSYIAQRIKDLNVRLEALKN